ncbi:MAG TPA: class I SAM-dependent methyltransferase [Kofleriaceae bacterium]|nr:class I SAM-dependent methyltransferase [Kofleriaceae bacterium]
MKPRRYQLRKEAVGAALHHPWIFRGHMSSAADVLRDGELLRLVDGANRIVGHGFYEATGAIAIRMLRRGPPPPDAAWLRGRLAAAVARRAELAGRSDAIRLVHGESDDIPAVVVDRFGDTLVVASYATGADAMARYAARVLALGPASPIIGPARHVLLRPARLRHAAAPRPGSPADDDREPRAGPPHDDHDLRAGVAHDDHDHGAAGSPPGEPLRADPGHAPAVRVLRGAPPEIAHITEDGIGFAVDLATGQKTGAYLDLRGLRRELAGAPLAGARVLNLFAYTGMLGRAAERAGAAAIVQVDASERALAFAARHHVDDPARHTLVTADVFAWLPAALGEPYDLVIVDPPAMTTRASQVPTVLAAYRKLYRAAARQVRAGGALVAACCTSRIERAVFHRTVREALGPGFTLDHEIPPEKDHPVGFPQADYLKIGWWRRAG